MMALRVIWEIEDAIGWMVLGGLLLGFIGLVRLGIKLVKKLWVWSYEMTKDLPQEIIDKNTKNMWTSSM